MGGYHQSLREVYAQYFFSVFDASLHQDEAGRRLAQQCLEASLEESELVVPRGAEPTPGFAW
jgi:3-methyladenine DNA glycosylase AlkC